LCVYATFDFDYPPPPNRFNLSAYRASTPPSRAFSAALEPKLGYWGIYLLLALCAAELFGHEFSWKIYASLFVLLTMFVLMFGYAVRIKFGDYEIAIEGKREEQKVPKERNEA
jgi:hypothetical protein